MCISYILGSMHYFQEPDPVVETLPKKEKKEKKPKKIIRTAAGETWEDPSLEEWEKGKWVRLAQQSNGSLIIKYIYTWVRLSIMLVSLT